MPVTRSVGKGRTPQPGSDPSASTSEGTGSSRTATTETTTTTGTTATTTDSEETSGTRTTTATESSTKEPPRATTPSTVVARDPPAPLPRAVEGDFAPPPRAGLKKKTTKTHDPAPLLDTAKSTRSRTKARKIAKAKEELFRIQAQLAAATLARMEMDTEDEEEEEELDEASMYSESEVAERVNNWMNQSQPTMLAITDASHHPEPDPAPLPAPAPAPEPAVEGTQPEQPNTKTPPDALPAPAGVSLDQTLTALTAAITTAIKAGHRPKFVELPDFTGSHREWLPFRAAFKETEETFSKVENINRLRKSLKGKAKEAVQSLLVSDTAPSTIMKTLESRFGRPESIAMLEMDTLRNLPRLSDAPRDICVFSTQVTNAVSILETLDCVHYLHNPEVSTALLDKISPSMRLKFYDFADTQERKDPALMKFEKFMKKQAELCAPYARPEDVAPVKETKRPQRVNTVTEHQPPTKKCPVCDKTGHAAADCETMKSKEVDARWNTAKDKRLCFRCLGPRNRTHRCKSIPCEINQCKHYHHRLLHSEKKEKPAEPKETTEAIINSTWTRKKQSYLKIIPVEVSGPKGTFDTYALLDDGSTVSLIEESIASSIGARGPVNPLRIQAIGTLKTTEPESRRVTVSIKGPNQKSVQIKANTLKTLDASPQEVCKQLISGCRHLEDISEGLTYEKASPGILIGEDNVDLLLATETRKGTADQPVASLTPLGWVLHGSSTRSLGRSVHFVSHLSEASSDDNIEEMMKQYFAMDAICLNPKKPRTDPEEQAIRILNQHTVHKEGRYETALLWKKEDIVMPENYDSSLKRLLGIEKKLDRDEELKKKYNEQMEALVQKGYAEPAPPEKTPNRTWYLPHFAVINPMKPGKLRVVHDAAAKTRGVSLNDMLLKGPDLLQSLPGVVMRFRQHEIAVTADIKEMFMQVKLREADRDALRYLWRKDRRDDQPPEEYRMSSLIFGASSSPSTAIYVKNINAEKYQQSHPEATAAIIKKHYVDDYLDSFKNLEDAVRIASDVRDIQKKAGYELKQWKSNSPTLIEAIGEQDAEQNTELYRSEEKSERVLGLMWKPKSDELTFNLNLTRITEPLLDGKTPTKREALRIVMSLFDPLGFASPVTIRAKQILQEVWRRGTSWDNEITEDLADQWKTWMQHLRSLNNVAIPRWYLRYSDARELQLHVFTDASESAYSAVLYWRAIAPNGEISISLIIAKAKVAPLKLTSIPRLELQAAVMGTRLAEAVIEEHEQKPDIKTFWTDSRTVLAWIKTGSRSYKPYVAHRLAAIEDVTTVDEWRWVPTKLNVADDATRDVPIDFDKNHRWYKGPDFLHAREEDWPRETASSPIDDATGEERVHHITVKDHLRLSEGLPEVTRFSSWDRLRFATARVLQFIQLCKTATQHVNYKRTKKNADSDPDWKKNPKKMTPTQPTNIKKNQEIAKALPLSAELLSRAENLLMRAAQEEAFWSEIENLKKEKPISRESRLKQLSVTYADGALRLRSRIQATENVPEQLKNPLVLDGNSPTVKLWIQAVHKRRHHAGVEATINECRQEHWILRLRPITRTLIRQCLLCRVRTQNPPHPRTGDLPLCRLAHHKRPFTYVGVDYFGPLYITVGRTHQKRYVAIFTCLTTRAVHLEIAATLSTDSAIMALRRMMARRGKPTQIWSDNGTNLRGADKELRRAIDTATAEEAAKKTISWRFIPPGAPFMGGAWERMVRSVKTALEATLHERFPSEEVLHTLLMEAEYSVNSRPLTHVSVNEEDPEALTPNHFLLGGPGHLPTPGDFTEKDTVTRASWRASQRLSDIFWDRWLKEYLPDLQNRREPHGRGPSIRPGDLVKVVDDNQPRNLWTRGKVAATFPGPDGIVRAVDVTTKNGTLRRPVRKLVILQTDDIALHPMEGTTALYGGRNVQDNQ